MRNLRSMEALPVLRIHPNHPYHHHCNPATIKEQRRKHRAPLRRKTILEAARVVRRQSPYRANERETQYYVVHENGVVQSWAMIMQRLTCLGYLIASQRNWMVSQVFFLSIIIISDFFFLVKRQPQCSFVESSVFAADLLDAGRLSADYALLL